MGVFCRLKLQKVANALQFLLQPSFLAYHILNEITLLQVQQLDLSFFFLAVKSMSKIQGEWWCGLTVY